MRRFLMLTLAVVLAAVPIPAFAQDATPAASTAVAAPATVYGSDGQPLGTLTLENLVDPFNDWDPGSPPTRGYRWVMATVTATAAERAWPINSGGFSIVDSQGFIAFQNFVYRAQEQIDALPDFPGDEIAAGTSVSGALFFLVFETATIETLEYGSSGNDSVVVADFRDAPVSALTAVDVVGNDGASIAKVTVDGVFDPVPNVDSSSPAPRGFRYVGVVVTIENTGTKPLSIDTGRFTIIDHEGFVSGYSTPYRTSEAVAQLPDFPYVSLEPGQKQQGLVGFQLLNGATVATVIYSPAYDRKIRVAEFAAGEAYPEPVLAPIATPQPPDPVCADAEAWISSLDPILTPVSGILDTVEALDIADANTPSALRDAATQIRAISTATAASTPPESVADANQQIVDTLDVLATQFEAMAAASEAGNQADFDAATVLIESALSDMESSGAFGELMTRCDPDQ